MEKKSSSNSRTTKTTLIMPQDANQHGTLFGGKLMAHIDSVAAISAMRHARELVVTASTDSVDFLHPIKLGDSITVEGFVTSTHLTSMEVFVKVVSEGLLSSEKIVCATAFLTFVALGNNGKPIEVPEIYPETETEKMLFSGAVRRRERRNERKKESQQMARMFDTE
jgi:acyl-CoA hydrolase